MKVLVVTELAKRIFSVNHQDPIINELDKFLDVDFSCRNVKKEDLKKYHSKILKAMFTTPKKIEEMAKLVILNRFSIKLEKRTTTTLLFKLIY